MLHELFGDMLSSVDEIVEALGGTGATARLTGVVPSAVSNWRRGTIPSENFLTITTELEKLGLHAAPSAFGFKSHEGARA